LRYRGWTYLKLDAALLALGDFEAAVRLDRADAEALCGRGLARARLGRPGAVEDAEAAGTRGPRTVQPLFNAACGHGRAGGQLDAGSAGMPSAGQLTRYAARAVELLGMTLDLVPPGERKAFWRENIRNDVDLVPVCRSPAMLELVRRYAR